MIAVPGELVTIEGKARQVRELSYSADLRVKLGLGTKM